MRRFLTAVFLAACLVAPGVAQTLPQLFQKAKEQVKFGSWKEALTTLDEVDAMSQKPGLEKDRVALEPAIAFYRGVCDAALDRPDDAKQQFAAYLKASPNATLDPAAYPKKAVTAFDAARASLAPAAAAAGNPSQKDSSRIAAAYRAFRMPAESPRGKPDVGEDWADGPVRFLMTAEERQEFQRLSDSVSRAEFIERFWISRDPKSDTPENEFRQEFEKRVAFADQVFVQGEKRGSYTDRGMVFVLLGPPTYSGSGPIQTGEDSSEPAGMFANTSGDAQVAAAAGKAGGHAASAAQRSVDAITGPGTSANSSTANWRETWKYMRKDLPAAVPYTSVDFDFITRPGYGQGILQKDPPALNALDRAKAGLGKPLTQP
jgi:GWxTD domain-containing protein